MNKKFETFLKDNWVTLFLLLLYIIIALSVGYGSEYYGFEKTVIVLLMVILIEIRLEKLI